MGLLSLLALIPAIRGETGTSLCMLAADYLLDSQDRKDQESKRILTEPEKFSVLRWACGKEWVSSWVKLLGSEEGKEYTTEDHHKVIIERWNEVRGSSLWLYDYEPFQNNFMRMAQKWVNAGCPEDKVFYRM